MKRMSECKGECKDYYHVLNAPGHESDTSWVKMDPREVRFTDPDTGGMKGQKPERYSLLPVEALAEVARVYEYGSRKYDDHNWRKGYAWSLSYDALQRHINAFWRGESYDLEGGLHHLAHATFHLFTLMTFDGVSVEDSQAAIDKFAGYLKKDDRP
jgi:hypothetical protein